MSSSADFSRTKVMAKLKIICLSCLLACLRVREAIEVCAHRLRPSSDDEADPPFRCTGALTAAPFRLLGQGIGLTFFFHAFGFGFLPRWLGDLGLKPGEQASHVVSLVIPSVPVHRRLPNKA